MIVHGLSSHTYTYRRDNTLAEVVGLSSCKRFENGSMVPEGWRRFVGMLKSFN